MRIYKLLFFSALVILTACSSNDEDIPSGIIAPQQMVPLLVDMHVADGNSFASAQAPDSLYKYNMGNYVQVLKKYHTDTVGFKKTFTWYSHHPDKLDKIYDGVIAILQARSDSLNKIKLNVLPAK